MSAGADVDVSFATMGAGTAHLLTLTQLTTTLKTLCPAADSYSAAAGTSPTTMSYAPAASAGGGAGGMAGSTSSNALSLAAYNKFIESFPGPLSGSGSSKDKVVKWCKERLAGYMQEEGLEDAPSWQVGTAVLRGG